MIYCDTCGWAIKVDDDGVLRHLPNPEVEFDHGAVPPYQRRQRSAEVEDAIAHSRPVWDSWE